MDLFANLSQEELNEALVQACDCDINVVNALLENGADPSGVPMLMAIQFNATESILTFLQHGVDLNRVDFETTPLIEAVILGDEKIVHALLEHGAEPNFADLEGKTPADWLNQEECKDHSESLKAKISEMLGQPSS